MYRPEKLRKYFMEEGVRDLLSEFGYEPDDVEGCVKALISRLFESDEFPHEIGLFLGYPSEDVKRHCGGHRIHRLGLCDIPGFRFANDRPDQGKDR